MHPLIYPRHTKVATLEHGWDGYSSVMMLSTEDDEDTVQEWYRNQKLSLDGSFDQYDFYTDDTRQKKVAEVVFATAETFEDLASYISSETLDAMVAKKPATIVVVFVVKN